MKIRVVVRVPRGSPAGRFFTAFGRARHLRCLAGHTEEVVIGARSLAVRCRVCGWTSSGVQLDLQQPRQLLR